MEKTQARFNQEKLRSLVRRDIRDFMRKSGCTRQQANYYLVSEMRPNIQTLTEIATGFGLPVGWFFDEVEVGTEL